VVTAQEATVAPNVNQHDGIMKDAVSGEPIYASARAFGSEKESAPNDCPAFDDLLFSTHSVPGSGDFSLLIDKSHLSYTAVYCQPGYRPQTRRGLDNLRNGTRVDPDPVRLYPIPQALAQRKLDPVDAAYLAIRRVMSDAESQVYYFSNADEDSFYKALKFFPPEEQQVLQVLIAKGRNPRLANLPRPGANQVDR